MGVGKAHVVSLVCAVLNYLFLSRAHSDSEGALALFSPPHGSVRTPNSESPWRGNDAIRAEQQIQIDNNAKSFTIHNGSPFHLTTPPTPGEIWHSPGVC